MALFLLGGLARTGSLLTLDAFGRLCSLLSFLTRTIEIRAELPWAIIVRDDNHRSAAMLADILRCGDVSILRKRIARLALLEVLARSGALQRLGIASRTKL